jgi:hypothetical protein
MMSVISYYPICEQMNQSLIPPFTGAEIVKANFQGEVKKITKVMVAPGICTFE